MEPFTTKIEDKHMIPFYFPLRKEVIYVNPKFFNEKWDGLPKQKNEKLSTFMVLTLDQAKEVEEHLKNA